MSASARRALHVVVEGKVQGVGYRAFVAREAKARGLAGWVRNRSDGSVEAVFSGGEEDIQSMIAAFGVPDIKDAIVSPQTVEHFLYITGVCCVPSFVGCVKGERHPGGLSRGRLIWQTDDVGASLLDVEPAAKRPENRMVRQTHGDEVMVLEAITEGCDRQFGQGLHIEFDDNIRVGHVHHGSPGLEGE